MNNLQNYILGTWVSGAGNGQPLYNAVNGEMIAYATTSGLILMRFWNMEEKGTCLAQNDFP